jgi:hypothetical protein
LLNAVGGAKDILRRVRVTIFKIKIKNENENK